MDTFSDNKRVVTRLSEHFQKLLNVPGNIDHEALDHIPQRITKTSLDEIPTKDEMARAIVGLKDCKAPGGDGIPAEVWKYGGDNLFSRLHQLITKDWEMGSVPQAWKDASIITIYKKGDRTDCGNYRGISLLSIAVKIFARILLNRLSTHVTPEVVPYRGSSIHIIPDFVSDNYKKSALSRTDHCTWYLSTSVRRSIQLG